MNYHLIKKDDMLNGDGLRVTVFCSGCDHHCRLCHNPETWDIHSGRPFDNETYKTLFELMDRPYISGVTFSGGDPLNENNRLDVLKIIQKIRERYKESKTVWLYSGYLFEDATRLAPEIVKNCDVIVDGRYIEELKDVNYPWAGSTNQRVVDVKKSLKEQRVVLYRTEA